MTNEEKKPPAPVTNLMGGPVVDIAPGMPELRISLIARAVRQSLRNYGHKVAESTLPECIAGDVERTLAAHDKAWPAHAQNVAVKAVEQEINRLSLSLDGEVTEDMLNEGQERMCQMASRTVFEDHIQAEIYKAMRSVDPAFRTTEKDELRLFGHWSKHRFADGVFLPLVCYVPTGEDYTTVPLYAPATPPPQPRAEAKQQ